MKICVRRVVWLVVVGIWAALAGVGWGQEPTGNNPGSGKRAMTFADLMAMKRVSDPQISASGKWVMFSVTEVSLEKNTKVNHLWVVPLEGRGGTNAGVLRSGQNDKQKQTKAGTTTEILSGAQNDAAENGDGAGGGERQVTFWEGESNGRFSPDGKWVSYSAKDQIWVAAWDEAAGKLGAARQLTSVSTGADGGVWSPDSKRVMFVSSVYPECSVTGGSDLTHDGETVMNGAPKGSGGTKATTEILSGAQNDASKGMDRIEVSGTRVVAAWKGAQAAAWAEEEACDKGKDAAADKSRVKGQVWEGLLYRHWEHFTGAKRSHVLVVDADGGNVRDLTPASAVGDAETPTFFVGGVQNYAWAPDGKEIAYVANLDLVPAASTNNDIFTLRLDEPGAKAVKVSTSPGSDDGPAYSPDGKWLAWRSQARGGFESDKFRLMRYNRASRETENLLPKFDGWVDEFVWAQYGSGINFVSGRDGEEAVYLVSLGREDLGKLTRYDVRGEFGDLRVTSDGLVATQMLLERPSAIVGLSLNGDSELTRAKDADGATPVAVRLTSIADMNKGLLANLSLPPMEPFWFPGAEGTKVEGFLLKPPNFDPGKKYPVKFLMHGGPQTAWGDAWSYRWNWELMAASGYVVIGVNRRGSTGYGQRFVDEVSGDWGGRAYEDLMKGLDYAEAKYPFIDKNRECALGASYGGFMADWVLTHTNRFQCIVTHDGMVDPVAAYGNTEELWFNEWEFRRPEDFPKGWDGFSGGYDPMGHPRMADSAHRDKAAMNGAPGWDKREQATAKTNAGILRSAQNDKGKGSADGHAAEPWRYQNLPAEQDPFRKWSPMRFIENAKTPTLVIHSQKDYRLDVSQGLELFTALQRLGVPSKMLYFPDEGHWILKPQNAQLWNEVVGDWCDRWTKTGKYAEKQ